RVLRKAERDRLPAAFRDEACSAAMAPLPVDVIAGNRPASNADAKTIAQANASTTPSAWMLCALGKSLHALASHFVAARDNIIPAAPPAIESRRFSMSCSRISVVLCAPSAL